MSRTEMNSRQIPTPQTDKYYYKKKVSSVWNYSQGNLKNVAPLMF